jgi:hypothetical protein
MAEIADRIPTELRGVMERKAFWGHPRDERMRKSDLLPIAQPANRTLFIRLVAHTIIGGAQSADSDLLCRLAMHPYRMIARAAAIRLIAILGADGMSRLLSVLAGKIENDDSLAVAIRDAEMQHYGVAEFG